MTNNPKDLIIQVLEKINYEGDKEKCAGEFIDLCYKEAFTQCVNNFSEEKQQMYKNQLGENPDPEKVKEVISQMMEAENYNSVLEKVGREMLKDYLETIAPTLNETQQNNLQNYLQSLV